MIYKILEDVMGVYEGTYSKTFDELDDSVTYLLDFYEKIYIKLNAKIDVPTLDQRLDNMRLSACSSCKHTIGILNTLDKELRNPQHRQELQQRFTEKKRKLENKPQPPFNNQQKLF